MISYHVKIFDSQSIEFVRERFIIDNDSDEAKKLKDDYKNLKDEIKYLTNIIEQTFKNGIY